MQVFDRGRARAMNLHILEERTSAHWPFGDLRSSMLCIPPSCFPTRVAGKRRRVSPVALSTSRISLNRGWSISGATGAHRRRLRAVMKRLSVPPSHTRNWGSAVEMQRAGLRSRVGGLAEQGSARLSVELLLIMMAKTTGMTRGRPLEQSIPRTHRRFSRKRFIALVNRSPGPNHQRP
jgi:hypothetical protein